MTEGPSQVSQSEPYSAVSNEKLTPHTAKPCRKAQDANLDSFNLAGAREKLRSLQSKVVSQTETGPPGPTSRLEGKSISDVLMVEIFAGSARLAKACRHMGCRSVAVDKTTDRSHGTKIFVCDVTNPDDLTMLEQFLQAEAQNLGWVHFAPACGTASKAREKPNRVLERAGFHVPKPLRSEEHPLGLPHLSGTDLVRTQAANQVYDVTARLARLLISWGVFVTIENPTSSLFWLVPCIAQLLEDVGGYDCIFDNCCHGGARKKNSRFWGSLPWLLPLAAACPGEHIHKHKNWQPQVVNGRVVYPTAEEAAYPTLLCTRMAEIVRAQFLQLGAMDVDNLEQQLQVEGTLFHRVVLSALPRGKRYKPLVSEYGSYYTVVHASTVECPTGMVPEGAKLIHQRLAKRGDLRVDEPIWHASAESITDAGEVMVSQFGMPREPVDFAERAVKCGHPRGMAIHLPELVKDVIKQNIDMPPAELALHRCRELTKWTVRAQQLQKQEEEFKSGLPPHMQSLMKTKRLLLFKEMLESVDYPDKQLVSDLSEGFSITGWQNKTGVFPQRVKKPQFSLATLRKMAHGLNKAILQQLLDDRDDEELVRATWDKTMEEVNLGYIWPDEDADPMKFFLAKGLGLFNEQANSESLTTAP